MPNEDDLKEYWDAIRVPRPDTSGEVKDNPVEKRSPTHREAEELAIHRAFMEHMLVQLGRADFAYEAAQTRAQGADATDQDRAEAERCRHRLEAAVHQAIEFGRGLAARPEPPALESQFLQAMAQNEEPQHAFCTNCEKSPWDHPFDSEPHCACGAPWVDARCSEST